MWGNALGWTISMLLLVGVIASAAWLQHVDQPTAPTAFARDAAVRDAMALPIPPRGILPDLTGPIDARPLVQQAIDAYLADRWTYDRAASGNIPDDFDSLSAIAPALDAAMSKSDALLTPLASKVVTFRTNRPELEALWTLGSAMIRAGMKREDSDPAGAVGYYNAVLALGVKMCRERLVFAEFSAGMALMSESSQRLARLVKNPRRLDELKKLEIARRDFVEQQVMPVWRIVGSIDPTVIAMHAGDLPIIATESKERMWRVEAVLALGRCKYFSPRPRDATRARKTLEKLAAQEPDPIVRQAALAARDMTLEDFRMLH